MKSPTTTHQVLLGLAAALLGALGVVFIAAPGIFADRVVTLSEPGSLYAMLRVPGTALLGETAAIVFALVSRSAPMIRVVSVMLVVQFSLETITRVGSFAAGETSTLIPAIPQALLALGLAISLVRSWSRSTRAVASSDGRLTTTVRSSTT